jgi:hypothetical protein
MRGEPPSTPLRTPVSRLTFRRQIEVHVFVLALGYLISHLPFVVMAKALSSATTLHVGFVEAGVPILSSIADAVYGRKIERVAKTGVDEPAPRMHWLADSNTPEPAAASLDERRHIAALIQLVAQKRLAEKFL